MPTFNASGTLGKSTILLTPTSRAFATCINVNYNKFHFNYVNMTKIKLIISLPY